jgi:hypothetical protein
MVRVPNTKSAKRSATRGRSQVVAKTKAGTRGAAKPVAPARAVSKDELRSQVQKLERANAALRAKNRQANRAAKLSAARISELEDEVARLRPTLVRRPTPAQLQCPKVARNPATSIRAMPCRRASLPKTQDGLTRKQRPRGRTSNRISRASRRGGLPQPTFERLRSATGKIAARSAPRKRPRRTLTSHVPPRHSTT